MTQQTASITPHGFELGELRSFRALSLIPLFPAEPPKVEYIGLDEAIAGGLAITEIGSEGVVQLLSLKNPLGTHVLLYEGEELVGAKQNRILGQTVLVEAQSTMKIPATCVERGRWSHRTSHFASAPRAAYPSLRRAQRDGQSAAWAEVAAKSMRLDAFSDTEAAEAMYLDRRASLDEYAQALPRLDGQSGVIVGIGGKLVCLDYVSRSDVFAGLYLKLLRGYALDAIEARGEQALSRTAVGRFLGELELATTTDEPPIGLAESWRFDGYASGRGLRLDGETIALSAFPA
jgi:hypothetical protein